MDNSILYTRCPTCSTAFKVTDELLAIAGGKVRCGACLAIFQASDYMLMPAKKAETVATEPTPSTEKTETTISEFLQKESIIAKPEPEPEPEPENASELQPEEYPLQAENENEASFGEDFYDEDDLEEVAQADNNQEINADEDEGLENASAEVRALETKEPAIEEAVTEEPVAEDLQKEISQTSDLRDQQLSFEEEFGLEELDPELNEVDEFDESEENKREERNLEENEPFDESFEIESGDQNHFNEDNGLAFDDYDLNETDEYGNESALAAQINAQIEDVDSAPDPLDEFNNLVAVTQSGVRSKIILVSISLLLVVALFQVWTNRQAIAWNETWGPMMTSMCDYMPCQLKPKRAVDEIKLLQRQVSPHQEKEKTLDIKVLLVNQAKFAQPYPIIKIAFSDKNGRTVATKRFKPSNYLKVESKNELMPPNAEVHIQFDTKTPHPDALGFEFIFE